MHASQRSEAGWMRFEREYLLWGFPKPLASWEMLLFLVDLVETWADPDVLHHGTWRTLSRSCGQIQVSLCAGLRGTAVSLDLDQIDKPEALGMN